jgi:hypothetical protein
MNEIDQAVNMGIENVLNGASLEERIALFKSLDSYFREKTRKKPSPDMDLKIEAFSGKIMKLAMSVRFEVTPETGRVSIKSMDKDDEETLTFLERGSEWFEGRDIGNAILESLLSSSS